jgi:transcriptional regulator with XRE-family HTH domain
MKNSGSNRKNEFKDKDYRHGYVDEFLNSRIATQIKVLREQREWSQSKLAEEAGMKQPRISVLENVNYSSWSINILRKLAEAFDLTLSVSFENFGSRMHDIKEFSRENLERCSFNDDPYFRDEAESEQEYAPPVPGYEGLGNMRDLASFKQARISKTESLGLSRGENHEASIR